MVDPWSFCPFEADVKVAALHEESQTAPDFLQSTLRVRMEGKAVRRASGKAFLFASLRD